MLSVLRHPSTVVHAARIIGSRIVPTCQLGSAKKWHRLPGNMTVTCKKCLAIHRRAGSPNPWLDLRRPSVRIRASGEQHD